jgi:hypothetical protein
MGSDTHTKSRKIFLIIIDVLLLLGGIGLIVWAAVKNTDGLGSDLMTVFMVSGFGCLAIGSVGIYAVVKEIGWLIYAHAVVMLLFTLGALAGSIVCFFFGFSAAGLLAIAGGVPLLGVCILALAATIVTFKLARNLLKSSASKSLENSGFPTQKSPEIPKK